MLGELLGGVWGRAGYWFMVTAVFIGFWDTVLADQDGFGRMFSDGTRQLALKRLIPSAWREEERLRRAFVVILLTVAPICLYLAVGEPVGLLKVAGIIEAAHIPVLAGLILYLNHQSLPPGLRASLPVVAATVAAGLFFAAFAGLYILTL